MIYNPLEITITDILNVFVRYGDFQRGGVDVLAINNNTVQEVIAVDFATIPEYTNDTMCRILIGCVSRLFENPDIRADYEQWKEKRKKNIEIDQV